jgi:16S rRNA (guanine527-N7)-methyltransferase
MNLTGMTSRERIINELFLDSLIPTPDIPKKGKMLDIGSGAGFPSIPIKIYHSSLDAHLVEVNSKKVSFLKQIIRLLKLRDIEVIRERIEDCENILKQQGYNLITSRAFTSLDKTISCCSRYLASNGILICFLGNRAKENLPNHKEKMKEHSLTISKILPYTLPGKTAMRYDVFLKKKG